MSILTIFFFGKKGRAMFGKKNQKKIKKNQKNCNSSVQVESINFLL